jgi:hypothetical protein
VSATIRNRGEEERRRPKKSTAVADRLIAGAQACELEGSVKREL